LRICKGRAPTSGAGSPAVSDSAFWHGPLQAEPSNTCQDWALHRPREVLHAQMSPLRRCSSSTQVESKEGEVLRLGLRRNAPRCLGGPSTSPRALACSGLQLVPQSAARSPRIFVVCDICHLFCEMLALARHIPEPLQLSLISPVWTCRFRRLDAAAGKLHACRCACSVC